MKKILCVFAAILFLLTFGCEKKSHIWDEEVSKALYWDYAPCEVNSETPPDELREYFTKLLNEHSDDLNAISDALIEQEGEDLYLIYYAYDNGKPYKTMLSHISDCRSIRENTHLGRLFFDYSNAHGMLPFYSVKVIRHGKKQWSVAYEMEVILVENGYPLKRGLYLVRGDMRNAMELEYFWIYKMKKVEIIRINEEWYTVMIFY